MSDAILVLNAGSSSLKFALYRTGALERLCRGHVERIGDDATFSASGPLGAALDGAAPPAGARDHASIGRWLLDRIGERLSDVAIRAAGHRIVHGGRDFAAPVRIDDRVIAALEALVPLAPNHQPHNLSAVRMVERAWPGLPQVACFDTAFHRTQPERAQWFALPRACADEGIVRYGFHGLSYEYLSGVLPAHAGERAEGRAVLAHLGHGASLCAIEKRRSVATTMGFTAIDGLMMGTRSGAVDPGVLLYWLEQRGMSAGEISDLLYNRSGLLGVSGISDDLRALEADGGANAEQAMDLFAYRAAREIGSLAAALGGLDVLVFSAGIGERSAAMRARIGAYSRWLGVSIDAGANARHAARIGAADSAVDVLVVPTDEEIVIARATVALVR